MIKKYYFTGLGNNFDGYGLYIKNNDALNLAGVITPHVPYSNSSNSLLTPKPYYGQRYNEVMAIGPSSTISGYLDYQEDLTGYVDPNTLIYAYRENTGRDYNVSFQYEMYFPPTFTGEGVTYYFTYNTFNSYIYAGNQKLTPQNLISSSITYSYSYNVNELLSQYGQALSAAVTPGTGILSAWVPKDRYGSEGRLMTPITDFNLQGDEKIYEASYNTRHGVDVTWTPLSGINQKGYSNSYFGSTGKFKDFYYLDYNNIYYKPVTSGINDYESTLSGFTFKLPVYSLSSIYGPEPSAIVLNEVLGTFDGKNLFPMNLYANQSLFNEVSGRVMFSDIVGHHYIELSGNTSYLHISNHGYCYGSLPYNWGDWSGNLSSLTYSPRFETDLSGNNLILSEHNNLMTSAPGLLGVYSIAPGMYYNFLNTIQYNLLSLNYKKEDEMDVYVSIDPQSYTIAL